MDYDKSEMATVYDEARSLTPSSSRFVMMSRRD